MLASLVIPRVIIDSYGSEANGLVTSLTQFVSYFTVVEAGIAGAATFALYRPLADKAWDAISRVVSAARQFYVRAGLIFVGLILALAILYPLFIQVTGLAGWQIALLVFALGASGFMDFFTLSKYRALLTADKKTWVIQSASSVFVVLNTVVIAWLGALQVHLVVVYTFAVLPTLVRAMILMLYARRRYPHVDYYVKVQGGELHQRWDAFFLQALSAAQQAAPTIIATIVLPTLTAVSVFSIYMLVSLGCQRISNILGTGMQAVFGEVMVKERLAVLQRAYREYELLVMSTTAIVCGVALSLIMPFIDLYTRSITDDNYMYPALGVLTVLSVFTYQIKSPHGLMIISAGLYRETRWRTLTQALILIIGAFALAPWFGFYGIMAAIVASNLYRTVDLVIFVARHVTKLPALLSTRRMFIAACQALIVSAPTLLTGFSPTTWLGWIMTGVALIAWGLVVVGGSNYLLDREDTRGIVLRFRRLLGIA